MRDGDVLTVTKPDRLSAQRHFELHGYREGRLPFPLDGSGSRRSYNVSGGDDFPADTIAGDRKGHGARRALPCCHDCQRVMVEPAQLTRAYHHKPIGRAVRAVR